MSFAFRDIEDDENGLYDAFSNLCYELNDKRIFSLNRNLHNNNQMYFINNPNIHSNNIKKTKNKY